MSTNWLDSMVRAQSAASCSSSKTPTRAIWYLPVASSNQTETSSTSLALVASEEVGDVLQGGLLGVELGDGGWSAT